MGTGSLSRKRVKTKNRSIRLDLIETEAPGGAGFFSCAER
jgi:hypothetical protein